MEPFRIACTTCKARLKVRSEEMIGQILACPRCQSMVHVIAPTDAGLSSESPTGSSISSGVGQQASDSISDSADASFDSIPDMLAGAIAPNKQEPANEVPANKTTEKKAAAAAIAGAAPIDSPAQPSVQTPIQTPAQTAPQSLASDALAPNAGWTSPTELLWRKIAIWGIAGGAGLFLVGGLVGVWIAKSGDTENTPPISSAASPMDDESLTTNLPTESDPDQPSGAETNLEDEPALEEAADKVVENENSLEAEAKSLDTKSPLEPSLEENPLPNPLVAEDGSQPVSPLGEPKESALPEKNRLKENGNVLPPQDELVDKAPNADPAPALNADPPAAVRHDAAPAAEWIAGDASKRLEKRLPRVSFQAVAMIDVVNFVSQTANVPITVDSTALRVYGISPNASVTIEKENARLSELLRAAIQPFELTYVVKEGQARVVHPKLKDKSYRRVKFPIEDLTEGSTNEAAHLASRIKRFVVPSRWDIAGGPGRLEAVADTLWLEQTAPMRFEVLSFCERLRLARGLSQKSRFPSSRFPLESGRTLAKKSLDRPITFTFHEPTPLHLVTRFLEQSTGQTILIDWQSLIDAGFTPSTRLSCGVVDRPLGEALTEILTPIGLGWRSLDAGTIRITSLEDARSNRVLVFYNVSPQVGRGFDEEQLRQLVKSAAKEAGPEFVTEVLTEFDKPSQRLIVLANQESHQRIGEALAAGKE